MMMGNHFFHLVSPSPWPVMVALSLTNLGIGTIAWLGGSASTLMLPFTCTTLACLCQWWRDVIRESLYEGARSDKINSMISLGVTLFIVSEVCFFGSFFWAYFYHSLSPDLGIYATWPPKGVAVADYLSIPLLNTLILLSSGAFITWTHHSTVNGHLLKSKISLSFCAILGVYFIAIQVYEYANLSFSFNDSVFSSLFYTLTGFHGFHVLVGLVFIIVNLVRLLNFAFSPTSIAGLEYSIWYWHFVDLVWLFLYCFVYWWGT